MYVGFNELTCRFLILTIPMHSSWRIHTDRSIWYFWNFTASRFEQLETMSSITNNQCKTGKYRSRVEECHAGLCEVLSLPARLQYAKLYSLSIDNNWLPVAHMFANRLVPRRPRCRVRFPMQSLSFSNNCYLWTRYDSCLLVDGTVASPWHLKILSWSCR